MALRRYRGGGVAEDGWVRSAPMEEQPEAHINLDPLS